MHVYDFLLGWLYGTFVEDARLLPDYRLVHLTSLCWTGALDYQVV